MKNIIAKVVSTKMTQTVVVEVERKKLHPLYKKIMRRTNRFKAHTDETFQVGDMVKIVSTKPVSKDKHFKVVGKL